MQEMVKWPAPTGSFSDSGEGGMFAWLVVPEAVSSDEDPSPNVFATNCSVDVTAYLSRPRVMLNRPDVCVSAEGRKVYEPFDHRNSWFAQSSKIETRLGLNRDADLADLRETHRLRRALHQAMGYDDVSVPMLAAVFLGSTSHSLWDEDAQQYFEVTGEHLSFGGKFLYNRLHAAFGVEPVILTFLDT